MDSEKFTLDKVESNYLIINSTSNKNEFQSANDYLCRFNVFIFIMN